MGYPIEIPNSFPRRSAVPLRDPLSRFLEKLGALWFDRGGRKRRRADHPRRYGRHGGVPIEEQRRWLPLRRADVRCLDWAELCRNLECGVPQETDPP